MRNVLAECVCYEAFRGCWACLTIGPSTRCRWVDREPTAGERAPGAEEGVPNGLSWRHFQLQGVDWVRQQVQGQRGA